MSDRQVVVMVGTGKGAFFYTSDEKRREWEMSGPHLPGWDVFSFMGEPKSGGRISRGHIAYCSCATVRVFNDLGQELGAAEGRPPRPCPARMDDRRNLQIFFSSHPFSFGCR